MRYIIIFFIYCFGVVTIISAQTTGQVMSLTELYALADSQSKTIKIFETAVKGAEQEISVAKNAYLPNIDFTASASYNSNAWVADRDFSNGQTFVSPHFGNSFSVEASQVVFAGGAIHNNIKALEIQKQISEWNLAEHRQQYDNAKADFEATKAKYDMLVRSKKSTALVKDEQSRRLEQNQTNIDVAKAEQHLAELNLSYTVIVAPCNGVTSRKAIQEGQFIQPGQTLLSLVEDDNVWILANYKETQTANIREGMPVSIKVDAIPGVEYYGEVETLAKATGAQYSIIPQDNSAGNFVKVEQRIPVKIVFTDENSKENIDRLRSGMNVECEVNY